MSAARLLIAVAFVAGCSRAPLRPLPSDARWAKGASIFMLPFAVDNPDWNADAALFQSHFQRDLEAAGLKLRAPPDEPGGDLVVKGVFVDRKNHALETSLSAERGSLEVAQLRVNWDSLDCYQRQLALSGGGEENAACIARALAILFLDDRSLASAAQGPRAVTASAPPGAPRGLRLQGKVAVLELRNFTRELTVQNAQYLTDVVRQAALKANTGADIMTRENLIVLLEASGRKLEECEGECEVDTGRRIGADAIISGEVQKLGSRFKISLRLHETREGKLLASATGTGANIDELDDSVAKAARELFQGN
jgi:hypothetical protein